MKKASVRVPHTRGRVALRAETILQLTFDQLSLAGGIVGPTSNLSCKPSQCPGVTECVPP